MNFLLANRRVGDVILSGLKRPYPDGVGNDDYMAADYLATLIAALFDDLNPEEQKEARQEVKRLYGLGLELRNDS